VAQARRHLRRRAWPCRARWHDWNEELDNFYVAEGLHAALVKAKPNLFTSTSSCVDTLNNLYPYVQDVSSGDMLKAIGRR
jgi:thioesterase domain-containing protein